MSIEALTHALTLPESWYLSLIDYTNTLRLLHPWLLPTAFGLIGACIGSYLNVIIYRLPRGMKTTQPARSFCPNCKAPIPWYLNIPIISWLMLRGRSACCHRPISPSYCIVEALTAALFIAVSLSFSHLLALLWVALWMAAMTATFFIDLETMTVMRRLTLAATAAALLAAAADPWILQNPLSPATAAGLPYAAASALFGYLLLKLTAALGMLLFGMRSKRYARPQTWQLRQAADGEDIELSIGSESLMLSRLLRDIGDRILLRGATLELPGAPREAGLLQLHADALLLPDGQRIPLEAHEQLTGSCRGYATRSSAMGSGDVWIAMAIGALTGWDGVLIALSAGSLLGLLIAITARHGFGRPMPFGPCLITAATLWWFLGERLLALS